MTVHFKQRLIIGHTKMKKKDKATVHVSFWGEKHIDTVELMKCKLESGELERDRSVKINVYKPLKIEYNDQ